MFEDIQENTIIAFLDSSVVDPMYNSYARLESQFDTLAKYVNSHKLYLFTTSTNADTITKQLSALSQEALRQIDEKEYAFPLESQGLSILKLGIAFYKKQAEIAYK